MYAYNALRDISNKFENDLQTVSTQLFTAKIGVRFEDGVTKKIRDLKVYSSKLKLLNAKPISRTPQVIESVKENVIDNYEETASLKVLEQMTVKSVTQVSAMKKLLLTPNKNLDSELINRKEETIHAIKQLHAKITTLKRLQKQLKAKESELYEVRHEWDELVGALKDSQDQDDEVEEDTAGPLYNKLQMLSNKLEMVRWMLSRAMMARGQYDWQSDGRGLLAALPHTRTRYTVHYLME